MGPTCSGKSTFLKLAKDAAPNHIELVEVGRMLRELYPPSYFKGQNNPKHTAKEAWKMCEDGVRAARTRGRPIVLVDGQPRDIPQVHMCMTRFCPQEYLLTFLLIDAPLEERERRARQDRKGEDLETLAIPRLTNDMVAYYSVLTELLKLRIPVEVFDSSNPTNKTVELLFSPLIHGITASLRPHLSQRGRRP